ncbi:MAG TPA: ester cyclase, partial [Flavobacteriales bacterium]|nr:ester cyclase [Flavobacteriales bacterium]
AMVSGTNTGSMEGMAATNKPWNVTGMDFIRFENGKAVEHWGLFDNTTMMTQLGLMPAMGAKTDSTAVAPAVE